MTLQQLDKWYDWIIDFCDEKRICEDIFGSYLCNSDGTYEPWTEPTRIHVEVYDVYGFTDFDILRESLSSIGVDYSEAEEYTGDFDDIIDGRRVSGRLYGFNIPLTK